VKTAQRLPSIAAPVDIPLGNGTHRLEIAIAYTPASVAAHPDDPRQWIARELVFVGRGKIGHGLDLMLQDLGMKISRMLQYRDPETGDEWSN
jgi:hypothetical protein